MPLPDPTMLLYLHACSRALPRVETLLDDQSRRFRSEVAGSLSKIDEVSGELQRHVERVMAEKGQASTEIKELYAKIATLEARLEDDQQTFARRIRASDEEHAKAKAVLEERMQTLRVDQEEALRWESEATAHKEALTNTQKKLEAMRVQHEQNVADINANHEDRKRKFRDVVVRKLRSTRDVMTAVGGGDGAVYRDIVAVLQQQGLGGAVGPASVGDGTSTVARLTEQLSGEVTAFERETEATSQAVASMEAKKEDALVALKGERERNSVLVAKNASHTQSLRSLQLKLEQLSSLRQTSDARRAGLTEERVVALREALRAERCVRGELEEELLEKQAALESLERERARAEEALGGQISRDLATLQLFEELLRVCEEGGRGRVGEDSDEGVLKGEPIRALHMHDRGEIARLLSAAMQCLVAEFPKPPSQIM